MARFSHILAAFILLVHGYDKLVDEHMWAGLLFLACGVIFLSVAIFHHPLQRRLRSVDAVFALLEGFAAIVLAVDMWSNKHYLQYAYLLVALIYLIRAIILFVRGPKAHLQHPAAAPL